MTDKKLSYIVIAVVVMLVVFQMGSMMASLFSVAWGVTSGALVAGVSFFTTRMAKTRGKSSVWFMLPTLIFTVAPALFIFFGDADESVGWFLAMIYFVPFLIEFIVPVLLLLFVYYELHKRSLLSDAV